MNTIRQLSVTILRNVQSLIHASQYNFNEIFRRLFYKLTVCPMSFRYCNAALQFVQRLLWNDAVTSQPCSSCCITWPNRRRSVYLCCTVTVRGHLELKTTLCIFSSITLFSWKLPPTHAEIILFYYLLMYYI